MTPDIIKATSRPLAVARGLTTKILNEQDIYAKIVILTGEDSVLQSENGRQCFMASLTLLSRIVGNLVVVLPLNSCGFETDVRMAARAAWSRGSIRVLRSNESAPFDKADAVLNIGTKIIVGCPCTTINSNGWVARVTNKTPLPADVAQPNPIAALMAASFGATEVFKRVFEVPLDVAPAVERIDYSLFEQSTAYAGIGPEIPPAIKLVDALLLGGGAIGNGIAWLLARLPLFGRLHVVDKQDFSDENLGTCILVEMRGWLGVPKAKRLAEWLNTNSRLTATWEKALIENAKSGTTIRGMNIDLVMNGLDNLDARREAQTLWPNVLVDGGINDIGAAVTQYRLNQRKMACLRCWFEQAAVDEKLAQSTLTGLDARSLTNLDRLLDDADIARAEASKREWLREQIKLGEKLCSIVSKAALKEKLGVEISENFRPSVPFVATAAAAMAMAETIKSVAFPTAASSGLIQIANIFIGADTTSIHLNRLAMVNCQCVTQRNLILRIAKKRSESRRKAA